MENILLDKVILHILDSNLDEPVLSGVELDMEGDVQEFLEKHILKVSNDGDMKNARFNLEGNEVYDLCRKLAQDDTAFTDVSRQLAAGLFSIMKQNPAIPSADLVFTTFKGEGVRYFGMLKLNYRASFIHYVAHTNEGVANQIIKQKTTLPGEAQKVDECVLINLDTLELQVLEKQYDICGNREPYLSMYFLKCETDLSYKQKLKILDKTVSKISKKHFDEDFEKVVELRSCLVESLEETGEIKVGSVAERVFSENREIQRQYVEEVKKAGLVEEVVAIPDTVNTGSKYTTQKIKTASGIEIKFPADVYNNKEEIEFINNPDGTLSILIKNVSKVVK